MPPRFPTSSLAMNLAAKLVERERNRTNGIIKDFIRQNYLKGGNQDGFYFDGVYWADVYIGSITPKKMRHLLNKELHQPFREHLAIVYQLRKDEQKIAQMFHLATLKLDSWQDIRDALPEGIHDLDSRMAPLKRTRPEGWAFVQGSTMHKQYLRDRSLIDTYIGLRFLA